MSSTGGISFAEEIDSTPAASGMSRKDRKKLEKEQKFAEDLAQMAAEAEGVNKPGDSPFTVTTENDAANEGSRNISLAKVSVSVNGKTLFRETTVKLSAGCRYGLMGPNGRGKSTLLRLISTRELPVQTSLDVLLVEQEQEISAGDTPAVQAVVQSHKQQLAFLNEVEALRTKAELTQEELERLRFLEEELDAMGASEADSKARRILFGLGFPTEWHDLPTKSFSGGWRKRIALASAVFIEPDVLLLDEPTNHLDLNAVIWLETYLQFQYSERAKRPKILVVVSHDAGFLDSICSHIIHIENFQLNYYKGSYNKFEQQVESRHEEVDKKHQLITKMIEEKKRNGMSNNQVEDWVKEQVRVGKLDPDFLERRRDYVVTFPFSNPKELRDNCIIKLENVSFNYPGGPVLFTDVNISLWGDSRITLCGPNGIGKSTLLNLMTGLLEPTSGYVTVNRQVRIGRYNQHFVDKLPMEQTPCTYLVELGVKNEFEARKLLGSFGLEGIVHKNMIATLSGGQKARVALAAISVEEPHLLLFDEPTNHLDLESIDALCKAINGYKGGVLVVTHDARLIESTNMAIWVAGDKNVRPFNGGLEDYKEHIRELFLEEERRRENERATKAKDKRDARELSAQLTAAQKAAAPTTTEKVEKVVVTKEQLNEVKKQAQAKTVDDLFALADKKKKKK